MKYVDIVSVKSQVDGGRLKTKLDAFGNIYLEDTLAGEAVKIGKLPEGYTFRADPQPSDSWKGKWLPCHIYTSNDINNPMQGKEGWACSECGWTTFERQDWCTCGADMRASKKPSKEFMEYIDTL